MKGITKMFNNMTGAIIEKMHRSRRIRRFMAKKRFDLFFAYYFERYLQGYEVAPFHKEMFGIIDKRDIKLAVITGFRNSGKSTVMAQLFPLWSVVSGRSHFIVLIAKTQMLARQMFKNLVDELESNERLKTDMGPFQTWDDQWGAYGITLKYYNAKIIAVSREQAIRGIRSQEHRPDLIVLDDIDDLDSVKIQESRDDTWRWFNSTIKPLGDKVTRIMLLGTPLHQDSLIMRLKKAIENNETDGVFKSYPIIDERGNPLWPGKFPSPADIEKEKRRIGDTVAWLREYLLAIVTDQAPIIKPEYIRYYDPVELEGVREDYAGIGVDVAISTKQRADYTAAVPGKLFGNIIYIIPPLLNIKVNFTDSIELVKVLAKQIGSGTPVNLFIEDVAFQGSYWQQLNKEGYLAEGVRIYGQDKEARLNLIVPLIREGKIRFPRYGAELLLGQLFNFGLENHDDLVDAMCIMISKLREKIIQTPAFWEYMAECAKEIGGIDNSLSTSAKNLEQWERASRGHTHGLSEILAEKTRENTKPTTLEDIRKILGL